MKGSTAPTTVAGYLASLSDDRRAIVSAARDLVNTHLPAGYDEFLFWGMVTWGIPLSRFPGTYNGQPLCYVALADRKGHVALYLMGVYGSPKLEADLKAAFKRAGKKLDMGKSCLRFQSLDDLALDAVGKAIAAVPPEEMIRRHDAAHGKEAVATRKKERVAGGSARLRKAGATQAAKKPTGKSTPRKSTPRKAGKPAR